MTGVILAGGKSTRIGTNKAFLSINGQRIIDRIIDIFRDVFDDIIIVTNNPIEYLHLDLKIVTDIIPKKGALGGIYTGLFYATSQHIFVTACDMPFINKGFIEYVISKAENFDVVVPCSDDGLQPLHAVYSKRCQNHIEAAIQSNRLKIKDIYSKVRVKEISTEEIRHFDPQQSLFFNINYPDDLEKAKKDMSGQPD